MKKIRIYLVLQEFEDGRVMFRRISPDIEGQPQGGPFQKQNLAAFQWLLEQAWNFPEIPLWPCDPAIMVAHDIPPFETLAL